MRSIYKVSVNGHARIAVNKRQEESFDLDGRFLSEDWKSPEVFLTGASSNKTDFYGNSFSGLVFSPVSNDEDERIEFLLAQNGDVLGLSCSECELKILNILDYPNPLDEEKTEWNLSVPSKMKLNITRYHFIPERLPFCGLFKMNGDHNIYVVTHPEVNPQDDFFQLYHQLGLKGLCFEKIWSES